jgi:hypothetical protein
MSLQFHCRFRLQTGEQAWAAFIGPLQYLYLFHNGTIPQFKDYKSSPGEIQLGISILPAMLAMQSVPGSLYHCPGGADIYPADDGEDENVSNENNFSAYAGLRILEFLLANNTIGSDPVLVKAKKDVDKLITGLEKWFETGLFSDPIGANKSKIVYQGGHVKFDGTYEPVGIMAYSGFAVDCQTWGMSTLIPYMGMEWLEGHLGPMGGYRWALHPFSCRRPVCLVWRITNEICRCARK